METGFGLLVNDAVETRIGRFVGFILSGTKQYTFACLAKSPNADGVIFFEAGLL